MTTIKIVNGLVVDGPNRAVLPNDYVKGSFQGTAPVNVVAASTSAVNISTLAVGSVIDGVTLALNDLVLLKDQTASNQNGIYRIGTLGNTEIDPFSSQRFTERNIQFISVFRGAVNAQTIWANSTITTTFNGTVFSTPLSFYHVSTGGGSGGVSSVSVVNANGLTGNVANPTTTPAITLGTSLSGILKGTGTGFATASPSDFPTLNQNTTGTAALATNLSGGTTNSIPLQTAPNTTAYIPAGNGVLTAVSSGIPAYTTTPTLVGTNFSGIPNSATTATNLSTASTIMSRDANSNVRVNSITEGVELVVAGGGVTTLTAASAPSQVISGALGQDFTLPDATTLAVNQLYAFSNFATGSLTIKSALGTTIITVPSQFIGYVSCAVNTTPNGTWAGYSVPTQSALSFSNFTGVATSAQMPIATTGALGGVIPDGTTITINGSGVISAVGGASSTQKFSIPGGAIPKVAGGGGGGANSLVWATAPNPVIDVFNFTNNSNWGMALGNVTGITPSTNISLTMNANVLASQSLAASQNFQLAYAIYGIANGTLVPVASGSTNSATLPVGGMCNLTFTSTAAPVGFTCTQLVVSFNATSAGATQNNYGIPCFDYTLTLS